QMPEMDGLEATRQIRNLDDSRYSTVPIIALTASALMETKRDVYTAGMNDYITKPFNPAELYRKLKKYSV
ncbi:MAG: response regulator, partial [Calditrichaeota bacterium]|nr:response regulator [Calditrichota bacterium]